MISKIAESGLKIALKYKTYMSQGSDLQVCSLLWILKTDPILDASLHVLWNPVCKSSNVPIRIFPEDSRYKCINKIETRHLFCWRKATTDSI